MGTTELNLNNIKSIIDKGIENATGILNEMINSNIKLDVPELDILSQEDVIKEEVLHENENHLMVLLGFFGTLKGNSVLAFPSNSANNFVSQLTGEDATSEGFAELRQEAITEIGNIVLNNVMGSITNAVGISVDYQVPVFKDSILVDVLNHEINTLNASILKAKTRFIMKDIQVEGEFYIILDIVEFNKYFNIHQNN